MSEAEPLGAERYPTLEVRVYRDGLLVHSELCESEDEAALIVDAWSEQPGVTCEVDDLSIRHRPDDVLAPEPPEPTIDYPSVREQD